MPLEERALALIALREKVQSKCGPMLSGGQDHCIQLQTLPAGSNLQQDGKENRGRQCMDPSYSGC